MWNMSRRAVLLTGIVVAGITATSWVLVKYGPWGTSDNKEVKPVRAPGFKEIARAAGIDFKMAFLPKEQGEKFKINLYDHGCGLAIADFDGDGYEDLYFVNQLGRNALYKNKGDGTFVDVTQEAGVEL